MRRQAEAKELSFINNIEGTNLNELPIGYCSLKKNGFIEEHSSLSRKVLSPIPFDNMEKLNERK